MNWAQEINISITVCDTEGTIVYMNDKSVSTFQAPGMSSLLGTNLFSCHPEKAREKIRSLMMTNETNVYTIEKNGKKKLIYQTPWIENGEIKGMVECALELPAEMPHFIRASTTK